MTKITAIQGIEESDWISCKTIRTHILKAYNQAAKKKPFSVNVCRVKKKITEYELYKHAVEIAKDNPEIIVFIDHNPNFLKIINSFAKLKQEDESFGPQLVFHVYGDFLIQAKDWISVSNSMRFFEVQFITSSTRQKQLVEKCLDSGQEVNVLPFPVDFNEFYYDPALRKNERLRLGLSENDFVFVYSGRLSQQKNDLDLLRSFLFLREQMSENIKIIFAGPFDDLGVPYFGHYSGSGAQHYHYNKILNEFPEEVSRDVIYLGNLSKESLNSLLNASDCFTSMSAHNDEDYGMAVAEAGAVGLKMVLSAWGGYLDLGSYSSKYNQFIALELKKIIRPKASSLIKGLALAMKNKLSDNERENISKLAQTGYSIESVSDRLCSILNGHAKPFRGFSDLFHEVNSALKLNPSAPFSFTSGEPSKLFKTLYMDYGNLKDLTLKKE